MKKTIIFSILSAYCIIGYAQKKVLKNTIAPGVTATATAKYYNVKTADEKIVQFVLQANKEEAGLIRYSVAYKTTPLGDYAEYRFVYNIEDSTYAKNLFKKATNH